MSNEFNLMHRFYNDICKFVKDKLNEYQSLTSTEKKLFKKKYEFVGRKSKLGFLCEYIKYLDEIDSEYTNENKTDIVIACVDKIRGFYKHCQSGKTYLCNSDIIAYAQMNYFIVAITKNTIAANVQWTSRLIKDMSNIFGHSLSNRIMVCSSQFNDLDGNATHCKTIHVAISNLTRCDDYRVLFVCSNNTRVGDINTLLQSYNSLCEHKRRPIIIQYDEAHNTEEGIPSKREIMENIIMSPYVDRLSPCTGTPDPLYDENNPLWKERNLEANAIDYTLVSNIKSSDPEYSSLHDAHPVYIEDIEMHPSYRQYDINEFDVNDFMHVDDPAVQNRFQKKWHEFYAGQGMTADEIRKRIHDEMVIDINKRRVLECHDFMKGEKREYNIGLNILDNIAELYSGDKLFIHGIRNIHIITTPMRVIFTYSLLKHALKQPYNPIVIGLYRSKITIMYKRDFDKVEYTKDIESEINDEIYNIITELDKIGINTQVPIIIIGNYKPTGESITFVNHKYGPIRSCYVLKENCTPAEVHQALCRGNYTTTMFKKNNPTFVPPVKYICSYRSHISNALIIEKRNDNRIDEFNTRESGYAIVDEYEFSSGNSQSDNNNDNISIPAKFQILDTDDSSCEKLYELFKCHQRDKPEVQKMLDTILKNGSASLIDKTNKFNFDEYTLEKVRVYKKKPDEVESSWRFEQYNAHHNQSLPYINDKNAIESKQFELYACLDRYEYKGYKNSKLTMWLSYKY